MMDPAQPESTGVMVPFGTVRRFVATGFRTPLSKLGDVPGNAQMDWPKV